MIHGLSPSSALWREMQPAWYWGNQEELLATLAELVDRTNSLLYQGFSAKRVAAPKPIKITRPGGPEKRPASSEELGRMFGRGSVRYSPKGAAK